MSKKTYKPSAIKAKKSSTTSNGEPEDKKAKKPIKYSSYLAGKMSRTSKYTKGGAKNPTYGKIKSEYEKAKNLEEAAKLRKKK